jgi:hypothetical protein
VGLKMSVPTEIKTLLPTLDVVNQKRVGVLFRRRDYLQKKLLGSSERETPYVIAELQSLKWILGYVQHNEEKKAKQPLTKSDACDKV